MNSTNRDRGNNISDLHDVRWEAAVKSIALRKFSKLQLRCPVCNREGTIVSKWTSGAPIKPVYIVHATRYGQAEICPVDNTYAKRVRSMLGFDFGDARRTLSMGNLFLMFSGGKDSLCLLEYIRKMCKSDKKDLTVLHADTTAGFPEVSEYVREVCNKLDVPLVIVRPRHEYFELAKRWGIPGHKSRWCCSTLKIDPIRRYLSKIQGPKVIYDGIRAAESNIRASYIPIWYHPSFRCISVSPIFYWSDKKVESYIKRNNLPESPVAKLGTSAECWCGAYKTKSDFEKLLEIHPDIFDKLVEVEEAQNGKYTFIYEKGQKIPLSSLRGSK